MRRIVEAAGGILYRWKDDAEPTRASSPSVKSNIATDGTIIANTTDSDGETTAAPGASDAASTPDPAQADSSHSGQRTQPHRTVHRASPEIRRLELAERQGRPERIAPACAVREIGEESGLSVELGPYLGDIEYPLSEEGSKQRHTKDRSADTKHIQFWMATPISAIDNLRRTHAFGPVHRADIGEIDEVLWLTPAEARKKLSHSTDKDILALFVDRVQEGALDAVPVIIVRHGKAEARKLWKVRTRTSDHAARRGCGIRAEPRAGVFQSDPTGHVALGALPGDVGDVRVADRTRHGSSRSAHRRCIRRCAGHRMGVSTQRNRVRT